MQAEIDAEKDKQDYYQQLLEDYKAHHEELRSAREHYARQQQLTAKGLTAARRARWGSLPRLAAIMALFQQAVAQHQGVSAGEKHVPDFLMLPDVVDAFLDLLHGHGAVLLPGEPAAGAVTAVHGALVRHQKQHPVRVPVGQALHG